MQLPGIERAPTVIIFEVELMAMCLEKLCTDAKLDIGAFKRKSTYRTLSLRSDAELSRRNGPVAVGDVNEIAGTPRGVEAEGSTFGLP